MRVLWMRTNIDLSDVWDEISDTELREEMERRCIKAARSVEEAKVDTLTPLLEEVLSLLSEGRADDARLTLERALYPKFKTTEESFAKFQKACAA